MNDEKIREIKESLQRRYKLAVQWDYCGSWELPEFYIIDTHRDVVAESGGSNSPEVQYEYFIEAQLEDALFEYSDEYEDEEGDED